MLSVQGPEDVAVGENVLHVKFYIYSLTCGNVALVISEVVMKTFGYKTDIIFFPFTHFMLTDLAQT